MNRIGDAALAARLGGALWKCPARAARFPCRGGEQRTLQAIFLDSIQSAVLIDSVHSAFRHLESNLHKPWVPLTV